VSIDAPCGGAALVGWAGTFASYWDAAVMYERLSALSDAELTWRRLALTLPQAVRDAAGHRGTRVIPSATPVHEICAVPDCPLAAFGYIRRRQRTLVLQRRVGNPGPVTLSDEGHSEA
jgi:hypothetical protein